MTAIVDPAPVEGGVDPGGAPPKGLRSGALGVLAGTAIGLGAAAPAYSLAAALGFVVAYVGRQAPIVMLIGFVPMLFVAIGYGQLNRVAPDCGTTFTWVTRAFGPGLGWLGGWAVIATDVIVMANLAQIAGQYLYQVVGAHGLAGDKGWTLLAGLAWIGAMTAIGCVGVEVGARVQYVLVALQLATLLIFSGVALAKVYGGRAGPQAIHPAWSWFDPFHASFSAFSLGLLTAAFAYWGWDAAVSVNEETRDRGRVPGRAAVTSIVVLAATYALVTISAQAFAGTGGRGVGLAAPDHSGDVLSVLGAEVFGTAGLGWLLAKLLVLMVLASAAASILSRIMPAARTALAMAVYRAVPGRLARIGDRCLTPTESTVGIGLLAMAFYLTMTLISRNVLADTISSLGLMIAFYYGLTGVTCAWWFRREARRSTGAFFVRFLLPLVGGLVLFAFLAKGLYQFWAPGYGATSWTLPFSPRWRIGGVFLAGIAASLFGVLLMIVHRHVHRPFFQRETLARETGLPTPEE